MALTEFQQAYTFLGNSNSILIVAGHKDLDDSYPAAISLAKILKANEKNVVLFSKENTPEHLSFLSSYCENVINPTNSVNSSRDLIISVNVDEKPIKSVSYKRAGSFLNINIRPKDSTIINEGDVHIGLSGFSYDLIISVGLDDLESMGVEFEKNAALFFETPIINIDKSSSNERYGEVNIIEPRASSCSEILTQLLREWDENLIDKKVATLLLSGIIASTNNFQNARTKPSVLTAAAYLMSREADQQEIIRHLFKTKPFEFLKLLGVAMTKFQYDPSKNLAWLTLTKDDFQKSSGSPKFVPHIINELKERFSNPPCLVVVFEDLNQSFFCFIHSEAEKQLKLIEKSLGGERRANTLILNGDLLNFSEQGQILEKVTRALEAEEQIS